MSKAIFLVGAPLPGHLDWENDELFNTPAPPFQDSESESNAGNTGRQPSPSLAHSSVKWRVLQPLPRDEPNDPHDFYYGPPDFLTTCQLETNNSASEEDSILSQFYDHSFAVHETSEISVSGLHEDTTQDSPSALDSIDFTARSPEEGNVPATVPILRVPGPVRDLQDIPTANYLQSIAPQTMTVNLIVGVIAVYPPRRIITRQWKTELDIVELIVGDETRSGFGVNFWLRPEMAPAAKNQETDRLRRSLATLRLGDIILVRTVGLSCFRDRVYGQSMRGGTQIELLHRRPVDATDAGGFYQSIPPRGLHDDLPLQKVRKVREWILGFVGATDRAGGGMAGMPAHGPPLPPDTP